MRTSLPSVAPVYESPGCPAQVERDPSVATKIAPLPHMFVIRDLVVDMSNFYAQYKSIKPYLQRKGATACVFFPPRKCCAEKWLPCEHGCIARTAALRSATWLAVRQSRDCIFRHVFLPVASCLPTATACSISPLVCTMTYQVALSVIIVISYVCTHRNIT